jgi:hypothetical protein
VVVLTALGTAAATLVGGQLLRLGCRFGLAGGLLHVTAHHRRDVQRTRTPCLGTAPRSREAGEPWHWLAVQTDPESIQTMRVLTRCGDHDGIASQ